MAQKVNPIAVRLGLNRSSESSWFSDYYYTTLFYKDLNCKHFLSSIRQPSGNKLGVRIARCVIHHYPKRSVLHLFCLTNKGRVKAIPTNIHNTNLHYSYDYRIPVVYDPKHKYTHLTLDALNSAFSVVSKAKELSEYNSEGNEFRQLQLSDISNLKLEHKQRIYLNLIKRICNHSSSNYSYSHLNSSKQILLLKRLEEQFKEMSNCSNCSSERVKLDKEPLTAVRQIPNLASSKVNLNTLVIGSDNIIKKLINDTKKRHCVDRFSNEKMLSRKDGRLQKKQESCKARDNHVCFQGDKKNCSLGLNTKIEDNRAKPSTAVGKFVQLEQAMFSSNYSHYTTFNSGFCSSKKHNSCCLDWTSMNQLYCASGWTSIMETEMGKWITSCSYKTTSLKTPTFFFNTLTSASSSTADKKLQFRNPRSSTAVKTSPLFPTKVSLQKTARLAAVKPQLTRKATQMKKESSSSCSESCNCSSQLENSLLTAAKASVLPMSVLSHELKANMNYLAMWYWMQTKMRTNTKFNCNYSVITQQLRAVRVTLNEPSLTKSSHYHFTNIQSFLARQSNTLTLIVPVKVSSIYQSASLVAQEICCKLEQKRAFRQICKSVFRQIDLCKYIKGIRISCSGRLNGAEIAKSECKKFGETSLHVFSDQIDYAYAKASTASGILGVKVWISYNCGDDCG